jgi:hypothetical protein
MGYAVYPTSHADDVVSAAAHCRPAIALISDGPRGLYRAGWRAAAALRAQDPTLRLVMLSTNARAVAEVGQTTRGRLFAAALQKPFPLQDLLETVAHHTHGPYAQWM